LSITLGKIKYAAMLVTYRPDSQVEASGRWPSQMHKAVMKGIAPAVSLAGLNKATDD
jgi:hypothetical protein